MTASDLLLIAGFLLIAFSVGWWLGGPLGAVAADGVVLALTGLWAELAAKMAWKGRAG